MKTILIAIDVQNDFMDITGASLPVPNAVKDTEKLCNWIKKFNPTNIVASLDSHYKLDISHAGWWLQKNGKPADPFTLITADSIRNGEFVARIDPKGSLQYVEALEANGEFLHFLWTDHCLIGTPGQALLPIFSDTLNEWSMKNLRWVNFINKGINPRTEHFGIFRANVPMVEDSNTQVNQGLFQNLNTFDNIFIAGQAKSHCVVNSLKQLLEIAPNLASKITVLEDCTSDVQGLPSDFYAKVDAIYADAKQKGVQFEKSVTV